MNNKIQNCLKKNTEKCSFLDCPFITNSYCFGTSFAKWELYHHFQQGGFYVVVVQEVIFQNIFQINVACGCPGVRSSPHGSLC